MYKSLYIFVTNPLHFLLECSTKLASTIFSKYFCLKEIEKMKLTLKFEKRADEIGMEHHFLVSDQPKEPSANPGLFTKIIKDKNIIIIDHGKFIARMERYGGLVRYFDWIFR